MTSLPADDHYQLVATPPALASLCERLASSRWLAIDTEFIRERSYYPQLCLIQVADADHIAIVDPLAVGPLDPLLDLLYAPDRELVFHAATQDLEIFFHLRGAVPGPVFDTQVAAAVLGHGEQVGYGALVKAVLGVQLEKGHARTDWDRRPLDPDQLSYAADDVRYLRELYPRMREELVDRDRLQWLDEDFQELVDPRRYRPNPQAQWLRIKGANRLRGVQLEALRRLAAWREETAERSDRPRRWIVKDEVLLDLARQLPTDHRRLRRIRGIGADGLGRGADEQVLRIIEASRASEATDWPQLPESPRLTPSQEGLADSLMAILRLRARAHSVAPGALATRRELERLINGDPDAPLRHGWRHAVAGRDLEAFLEGRTSLLCRDGELALTETRSPDQA